MTTNKKIMISIVIIILIIASFFTGRYVVEQENKNSRIERCSTLVTFAIDKVENGDLSDEGTMKALISNVYAAYQFCDNTTVAEQLHALWNYLIFESDANNIKATKDIVIVELNDVLRSIKTTD